MNGFGLIDIQFEHDYRYFEENRMYPLGYVKESAMTKIKMEHHDSIVRAQTSLIKHYVPTQSAPGRRQFDDDLLRLDELKKLLMQMIFNPDFHYGPTD